MASIHKNLSANGIDQSGNVLFDWSSEIYLKSDNDAREFQ